MGIFVKVTEEFTETPGGRFKAHGDYSAEEFRDKLLRIRYDTAKSMSTELVVDLDGGYGYSTPFLKEAFGGLVRQTGEDISKILVIRSRDDMALQRIIEMFIKEAYEELSNNT